MHLTWSTFYSSPVIPSIVAEVEFDPTAKETTKSLGHIPIFHFHDYVGNGAIFPFWRVFEYFHKMA